MKEKFLDIHAELEEHKEFLRKISSYNNTVIDRTSTFLDLESLKEEYKVVCGRDLVITSGESLPVIAGDFEFKVATYKPSNWKEILKMKFEKGTVSDYEWLKTGLLKIMSYVYESCYGERKNYNPYLETRQIPQCQIHSKHILEMVHPKNYTKFINFIQENEIIKRLEYYVVNEKCYTYTKGETIMKSTFKKTKYEQGTYCIFRRDFSKLKDGQFINFFREADAQYDITAARKYCKENGLTDKYKEFLHKDYDINLVNKFSDKCHRLYTNYNRLPKKLKQFVKIRNHVTDRFEKIVNVDMKSAHMLMLIALYRLHPNYGGPTTKYKDLKNGALKKEINKFRECLEGKLFNNRYTKDFYGCYFSWVEDNDKKQYNTILNNRAKIDWRSRVKQIINTFIATSIDASIDYGDDFESFFAKEIAILSEVGSFFEAEFPILSDLMNKHVHINKGEMFVCSLMKIEAYLIGCCLGGVWGKNVHDCISVVESNAMTACETLQNHIVRYIDLLEGLDIKLVTVKRAENDLEDEEDVFEKFA